MGNLSRLFKGKDVTGFIKVEDPDLLFIFTKLTTRASLRHLKRNGIVKVKGGDFYIKEEAYSELAMVALELRSLFGNRSYDEVLEEFKLKIT